MGNTATKESGSAASSGPSRPRAGDASSSHSSHNHGSTSGRARSRSNLGDGSGPAIFTISTGHGIRDREAERAAREERKRLREEERKREKERSLREESVDGGFLATHGVYTGIEDWKDKIVRNLIVRTHAGECRCEGKLW